MSGLRYILDFSSGNSYPSFNKDPFYLGGYKNIAHYRGGSYGRAQDFKIGISDEVSTQSRGPKTRDLFNDKESSKPELEFTLTMGDDEGEPRPVSYEIKIRKQSIQVFTQDEKIKACVSDASDGFTFELTSRQNSRFLAGRSDFLSLEYILRDLALDSRNDRNESSIEYNRATGQVDALWSIFRRLSNRSRGSVFALAPVRTRPHRNYDPTQLSQSSEGDQLIGRIGRMARVDVQKWQKIKENLEAFGRSAGLFETIKIQKLGRGETDPFQILVKTSGREANIIDVGYGVSQILPLFILLSEQRSPLTFLIQQPEVHLHPSAQAALGSVIAGATLRRRGPSFIIETHSDFIVDRLRLAVREGKISPKDLQILFFKKEKYNSTIYSIDVDKSGDLIDPPAEYREFFVNESLSLMGF